MCHGPENSLQENKLIAKNVFLAGQLTEPEMIGRIAAAENAERVYKALMWSAGWTQEQLLLHTGYTLSTAVTLINKIAR